MTFLNYYEQFGKLNKLPENGLCNCLSDDLLNSHAWSLVCPTYDDLVELEEEAYSQVFWGSDLKKYSNKTCNDFGERRKFILLFAAAINGEFDKLK